jgi:hypothetical protein
MKIGLIEPHYLPSLEYFCAILPFDRLVLEKHEHYVKQSYRSRCYINAAHGEEMLVVPLTAKHGKVAFKDIRIDYTKKWQNLQWRTIQSAYAKAPFFEHYSGELSKLIYANDRFLFDHDRALLSFCLKSLGLSKELSETAVFEKGTVNEGISDLRWQITPKNPFSMRSYYRPMPYYQVFGNAFAANLSLIDLLFCEGPNALHILRASKSPELNK